MNGFLLDANVLIAAVSAEHVHHERVNAWLETAGPLAVDPLVQGALTRFLLRIGETAATASAALGALDSAGRLEFWADDLSYADLDLSGVTGHRQVADVYLARLAARRGWRLATLDEALAALRPADVVLLP